MSWKRFARIHLATACVLMLGAGVLLWVNFQPRGMEAFGLLFTKQGYFECQARWKRNWVTQTLTLDALTTNFEDRWSSR